MPIKCEAETTLGLHAHIFNYVVYTGTSRLKQSHYFFLLNTEFGGVFM